MVGGELNRMFDVGLVSDHYVLFNHMFCPRIHATSKRPPLDWRGDERRAVYLGSRDDITPPAQTRETLSCQHKRSETTV
jgi:hypothetical protein